MIISQLDTANCAADVVMAMETVDEDEGQQMRDDAESFAADTDTDVQIYHVT